MMLPEEDAQTKICPFLKTSDDKFRFCKGAKCMMWRYRYADRKGEQDSGYCGLAGKPAGAI